MKLPSLQTLWQNVNQVVRRFPLQFSLAIVCSLVWWYLIENPANDAQLLNDLGKALLVGNFAFTLLLAGDLFSEVNYYTTTKKWLLRVVTLAICFGIYFLIDPFENKADLFRAFLMAFAFHLLVSFAPFLGKLDLNGFWQYNKTLFLQFLTAAFYAVVLFAGLSIALVAIDGLFNVAIEGKAYMKLFALVSAGFSSIFFLAGVPTNFTALATDYSYPKGLKIFTQYVLIPLMTIYLAILLVYEVKIILIWSLPKGIVSSLILGYAVFGILSLLLIHPIKDKPGNGWMKLFSQFFYLMMIPLVVLLILAIIKRTANYGITEPRYILMALAFWLSGITLYFLLSKKQNIKVIPISLCVLTALLIYGPQSAFSISKYSQVTRLTKLMERKDQNESASVVRYLIDYHGLRSLQPFIKQDLTAIESKIDAKAIKKNGYQIRQQKIDTAFSLLKIENDTYFNPFESVTIKNDNTGIIKINGYEDVFSFSDYINDSPKYYNGLHFKIERKADDTDKRNYIFLIVSIGNESVIKFNVKNIAFKAFRAQQSDKLKEYKDPKGFFYGYLYPSRQLELLQDTENYTVKLIISSMTAEYIKEKNDFESFNFEGALLIKKKK